jgi:uncharacterized protein YjbJ (UPF0337 family)
MPLPPGRRVPMPGLARPRQQNDSTKGATMSIFKKLAHKAEAVKGGAKKAAGRATGNSRLKAEGRGDQVKGDTKMAWAKIKDAFKK